MPQIDTGELLARDRVDPSLVPSATLSTGAVMPAIGLGTFGSDHVSPAEVADAVVAAAKFGYRHFDCASVYGNEEQIGRALAEVMRAGTKREELWITSKLWNDKHGEDDVTASCEKSIRSEEHTSELQSLRHLVCRLLLEK